MGSIPPSDSLDKQSYFLVGDKHEFDPEKWANDNKDALPKRGPETHIKVLIVGAGFAGLMAALECWRNGHEVTSILERSDGPNFSGDLIIIQPSVFEVIRHWPQMVRDLEEDKCTVGTYYYRHDGELIDGPCQPNFNAPAYVAERESRPGGFPYVGAVQIRKKFYRMLLRQVARLGFKVEYGQRVERYFEDEAQGLAGVSVGESTSPRTAHVVVAADGFRSRSELLIAGEYAPTFSSGMSLYRTAFPAKLAFESELVRQRWEGKHTYEFWMGSGMHIGLYISSETVAFGITPRDELLDPNKVARESWDPDIDPDEVVEVLRRAKVHSGPDSGSNLGSGSDSDSDSDWHPVVEALVRTAPRGNLIHWPLRWRNLREDWVSKGGRVVQIGDAAHSTIPSSAAGGTLALEDAITLAACLRLASSHPPPPPPAPTDSPSSSEPTAPASSAASSSSNSPADGAGVPLGNRVYNLLRYERASCTQKMAFVNAQALGATTDWDDIRKNPEKVRLRYPKWLFRHNPETYAQDKFGEASSHIIGGSEFRNTNIPPGHKFVHWTLEEILEQIAAGKRVEHLLDGDWT